MSNATINNVLDLGDLVLVTKNYEVQVQKYDTPCGELDGEDLFFNIILEGKGEFEDYQDQLQTNEEGIFETISHLVNEFTL